MQTTYLTPSRFALFFCAALFALLLTRAGFAEKTARVFVDSEASVTYHERKESDQGALRETYVFMEGNLYGGGIRDKSLTEVSFKDIAAALGEDMKARNFYPAASPTEGDLLIIVHYGSTSVPEDLTELFQLDPSDPYADETYDFFTEMQELSDFNEYSQHSSSMDNRKLGIGRALNRKNINAVEEFDLRVELEDERYFIILMAYDYKKLRTANEKELLWTTRFSLPAIGTNFVDAYPALTRAAQAYYGVSLEKYAKSNTHFGTESVEFGKLETVDVIENNSAKPETDTPAARE